MPSGSFQAPVKGGANNTCWTHFRSSPLWIYQTICSIYSKSDINDFTIDIHSSVLLWVTFHSTATTTTIKNRSRTQHLPQTHIPCMRISVDPAATSKTSSILSQTELQVKNGFKVLSGGCCDWLLTCTGGRNGSKESVGLHLSWADNSEKCRPIIKCNAIPMWRG